MFAGAGGVVGGGQRMEATGGEAEHMADEGRCVMPGGQVWL